MPGRRAGGAAVFVIALAASLLAGAPPSSELPEVALDWTLLLHVERAFAMVGLIALAALIWWRANQGQFPTRFGNIEYAVDAVGETRATLESHARRIENLEDVLGLQYGSLARRKDRR